LINKAVRAAKKAAAEAQSCQFCTGPNELG
jgi:hypothetical protein